MATTQLCCFSDDGEYFAHSSLDGTLRIFECATATLKQEYCSSSHLLSTTSSLTWSRLKKELPSSPNTKKKKLNDSTEEEGYHDELKLIALGTTAGTVYLYSFAKGLLHTQLTGAHTSTVNDICWHLSKPELFTCSDDQNVVQWDLKKGKVRHKWKCDSSGIHSVCLCSQNKLLTASNSIKLWDLDTMTVLQTFSGHSSPIFRLIPVWSSNSEAPYVLSASFDERHIQIWHCGDLHKEKLAVGSFSVPDEPVFLSLCKPTSSQTLMLSVITRKGIAYIFEHILNGKKSIPVISKVAVKAAMLKSDEQRESNETSSVPILASAFSTKTIIVAYGNPVRPIFERVKYDATKSEVVITVKPTLLSLSKEEYSQVKRPEISKNVTTMIPADSQPVPASRNKGKKRIRRTSVTDLTVEERLAAMSTDTLSESHSKQPPIANTLSKLLQQALLSGDHKLLTGVFQETNESIVKNTIKRLPLSCIVPLVKVIEEGMMGHAQHAWNLSRWTACLISCHASYMLSVPEIIGTMNKLYQTLISRQKFFPKMLQLKGRLDLVKQGGNLKESEEDDTSTEPLLVYKDESDSDESEGLVLDGNVVESDENWESDMES